MAAEQWRRTPHAHGELGGQSWVGGWTPAFGLAEEAGVDRDGDGSVVILGAGILGCSIAVHLADRGVRPVLIDPERPGQGTSTGSFASVSALGKDPAAWFQLAAGSRERGYPVRLVDRDEPGRRRRPGRGGGGGAAAADLRAGRRGRGGPDGRRRRA